jgi:hypothetical protein
MSSSCWIPNRNEWEHVARLAAARGVPMPHLPLPVEAKASPALAQALTEGWQALPPPYARTPLTVRVLGGDALDGADGAAFDGGVVSDGGDLLTGVPLMPTFQLAQHRVPSHSSAFDAPMASAQQLAHARGFSADSRAARLAHGRRAQSARATCRGLAAHAHPTASARHIAAGRSPPSPPPPSPEPGRTEKQRASSARLRAQQQHAHGSHRPTSAERPRAAAEGAPALWTRPIAVDGPGVANALAFQQPVLA